jgi:hypothetical protein
VEQAEVLERVALRGTRALQGSLETPVPTDHGVTVALAALVAVRAIPETQETPVILLAAVAVAVAQQFLPTPLTPELTRSLSLLPLLVAPEMLAHLAALAALVAVSAQVAIFRVAQEAPGLPETLAMSAATAPEQLLVAAVPLETPVLEGPTVM